MMDSGIRLNILSVVRFLVAIYLKPVLANLLNQQRKSREERDRDNDFVDEREPAPRYK